MRSLISLSLVSANTPFLAPRALQPREGPLRAQNCTAHLRRVVAATIRVVIGRGVGVESRIEGEGEDAGAGAGLPPPRVLSFLVRSRTPWKRRVATSPSVMYMVRVGAMSTHIPSSWSSVSSSYSYSYSSPPPSPGALSLLVLAPFVDCRGHLTYLVRLLWSRCTTAVNLPFVPSERRHHSTVVSRRRRVQNGSRYSFD